MPDQLFTKYVGKPLVILCIRCADWGDTDCFDGGGYLGIKRAGARGRGKKGIWGKEG
jgi:hypothetical protein